MDASRQAVVARPIKERFRAALTIGLAIQACYLVEVDCRKVALQWVLETLAASRAPFLKDMRKGGRRNIMSLLWYYLLGRDAVGSQVLSMFRNELWDAIFDGDLCDGEKEAAKFWIIVGLIEAGCIAEAEEMIAEFNTEDASLMLAIHLGCFQLDKLRATAEEDRVIANRIMVMLAPRIQDAHKEFLSEYETELVEIRAGRVERISTTVETTGGDEEGDGSARVGPSGGDAKGQS